VSCSRGHKQSKQIPYGQKRGLFWCGGCDRALVPEVPSKKRERQNAKRQIREERKSSTS
jgi:hypothetical protein